MYCVGKFKRDIKVDNTYGLQISDPFTQEVFVSPYRNSGHYLSRFSLITSWTI